MSYTNLHIDDNASERKHRAMILAELKFWQDYAVELQMKLDNIPRAVRQYGHIDIIDGNDTLTLVAKAEDVPDSIRGNG